MSDSLFSSDAELVARIRAGDRSAIEEVFRAHYATLLRFAFSRLGDRAAAEEVVEEVFAGLIVRHASVQVHGALEGYLVGAVRNAIFKQYRSERREQARRDNVMRDSVMHDDLAAGDSEEAKDNEQHLARVIAALPERQQTIITMRWMHGAAYEDIAETLGMTVAAVKMQASRTLRMLRRMLNAG